MMHDSADIGMYECMQISDIEGKVANLQNYYVRSVADDLCKLELLGLSVDGR